MGTNLMEANHQWATRPADERFQSLVQMHAVTAKHKQSALESHAEISRLRVEGIDGDLRLVGKSGRSAALTHWSMGQLSQRAKAPAHYLRGLPATLAAQNLNHGLKEAKEGDKAALLFREDDSSRIGSPKQLTLHAAVTDSYTRIWNCDIVAKLLELQARNPNWKNPRAYAVGGKMSGEMVPSGLYASDQDMFAFLVDESRALAGSPGGLKRGFFIWNSEVGATAFGIMAFLYDYVCGNNIVWNASNVSEIRIRHVGRADETVFDKLGHEVRRYADSSASVTEAAIRKARGYSLGASKMLALETLIEMAAKQGADLNDSQLEAGLQRAEQREERYGDPRSLWAAVGGLTELSQEERNTDKRVKIDRAAGKLLRVIDF